MKGKLKKEDARFPHTLRVFAPDVEEIYVDGDINLLYTRCAAVVGTRDCTRYGVTVAKDIGQRLAASGVTVISGLARGIDTAGHQGALDMGGKTIAVLAGGTDRYYPPENQKLQKRIAAEGLLISEHPPEYTARKYDFPVRNRMISALSESVVIVEAKNRSGALITAECAIEQGKRLYAVPGNITSHFSFGTNKLIRDGAEPLICIEDILTDMDIEPQYGPMAYDSLGEQEKKVFDVINKYGEVTVDEIYHKTNIKPSEINGIITILEMKGVIFSCLGKIFVAKF